MIEFFAILSDREDCRMVNYERIAALVNQIPVDTWDVLRKIKERRPAIMLSELIDYRKRELQQQEPPEPRSPTNEAINEPLGDTPRRDQTPSPQLA